MKNTLLIICAFFVFTSCGTSRTIVSEPVTIPESSPCYCVQIEPADETVHVPARVRCGFERCLCQKLYADERMRQGDDLKLRYSFLQFDKGNYLLAGRDSSIQVEVCFFDAQNTYLGKIQVEGNMRGESIDNAVEQAALAVAEYTLGLEK